MKSVVVGTAGHVDHGKTALVKALTGIDADRLEEEKRRGITIDIGFAHMELSSPTGETLRFSMIDVPGHERFVRNMLAGIGGIDLVLLVIAADEGVMPQTREHFDICRLLGIRHGITVLTKSDLVDEETLRVVQLEIREFLRGSFLEAAPVVSVSAVTGDGIDQLKRWLVEAGSVAVAKDAKGLTRLPIDRIFTMKGFGTVVTGTLVSGSIQKDEELELFPGKKRLRVRGVQVHGVAADRAVAGERTALNLASIGTEELSRGMALASASTFQGTTQVDVSLSLLKAVKPLKDGARVHFHAHSLETVARVFIHSKKLLAPGEDGFARLKLAESALLLPGDRFIIRQYSPLVTIGGGEVLDAQPLRKASRDHVQFLTTLATANPANVLKARIQRRAAQGLLLDQAVAETGWRAETIERHLTDALRSGEIARAENVFVCSSAKADLERTIAECVTRFQETNPLVAGMNKESLRDLLRRKLRFDVPIFDASLNTLAQTRKLEIIGEAVRLPGRGVVMKDEESESRNLIEQTFAEAGLKVPALKDVLAGLKLDKTRAQKIVTIMLREKNLIKISDDLVFHQQALQALRQMLKAEKLNSRRIDVGRFKDLTGVSRKFAIPLLEYLDREQVTRREGDARVIL